MRELHRLTLQVSPECKLWFFDMKCEGPAASNLRKRRAALGKTAPNRSSRLGYGREVHFERAKHPPMLLVPIAYFRLIFWSQDFHGLESDFHRVRTSTAADALPLYRLAAAAGAAAAHAAVTATVARHDAAAEAAAGRVSEVDDAGQSVGRVDRTSPET